MIQNLSENVIMPIAGIILTFIACYELIQLVISHNNLANFETWIFYKGGVKTFVAVAVRIKTSSHTNKGNTKIKSIKLPICGMLDLSSVLQMGAFLCLKEQTKN